MPYVTPALGIYLYLAFTMHYTLGWKKRFQIFASTVLFSDNRKGAAGADGLFLARGSCWFANSQQSLEKLLKELETSSCFTLKIQSASNKTISWVSAAVLDGSHLHFNPNKRYITTLIISVLSILVSHFEDRIFAIELSSVIIYTPWAAQTGCFYWNCNLALCIY